MIMFLCVEKIAFIYMKGEEFFVLGDYMEQLQMAEPFCTIRFHLR